MSGKVGNEPLRRKILEAVREYYRLEHAPGARRPEGTRIPYAGRVFDETELEYLTDATLDFWLTAGRYADRFERELAEFLGIRYCSLVNSGSSANLLAFMALTQPELGERRIRRGDEVITVACGFPTTVAPIVQYGAVPVFVDITLPQYNADISQLEAAWSARTKAVMIAHTLGNPFDLKSVREFCDRHGLWLVEDNCDALGSKYCVDGAWRYTGTFGDIGTSSFYPPHHITMGEGGAVYTNEPALHRIVTSLRDWGRDCCCPPGTDNWCGHRFNRQFGELPAGYDHKYVYSHLGYNLKATDLQAAIGCAQLRKLPDFIEKRKQNWALLREGLEDMADCFVLPEPAPDSDPSWFGFLLTVRQEAPFTRDAVVQHLERQGIQTRMLFAGNLTRHPCFTEMPDGGESYRRIGALPVTDRVMRDTFWIGVYPGLTLQNIQFVIEILSNIIGNLNKERMTK